jgi:predicted XRE-type DNA-binding protein
LGFFYAQKEHAMKKKIDYTPGSGNVFADLGFPDAEEMLAKADLAIQINDLIKKKKLTKAKVAALLAIDQEQIVALSKGLLSEFSFETLFRFLSILGKSFVITVIPKARSKKQDIVDVSLPKALKKKPVIQRSNDGARTIHAKKK